MLSRNDIARALEKDTAASRNPPVDVISPYILEVLLDIREFLRRTDVREQPDPVDFRGRQTLSGRAQCSTCVRSVNGPYYCFADPGPDRCSAYKERGAMPEPGYGRCGPDFGCIHYEEKTEVNA
jgi:hypothetical protein